MGKIKSVLFIVNPISGVGKQKVIETLVDKFLDPNLFSSKFSYTRYAGHATEIADKASNNYDIVVAVGGDGTMNEVSAGLLYSNCAMGVIPTGSGNGFARHLHIPLKLEKAVQLLNTATPMRIDTATLNGRSFVNVSGIGFDAHIGHKFADYGARGPLSYVRISTNSLLKYTPKQYRIVIDGKRYTRDAFMISFANTTQFGNNAHIAPQASVQDGLLDVSIVHKFPMIAGIPLAIRLFNKKLPKSKFYENYKCKVVVVENIEKKPIKVHIDGEPEIIVENINVSIKPNSLLVLC